MLNRWGDGNLELLLIVACIWVALIIFFAPIAFFLVWGTP